MQFCERRSFHICLLLLIWMPAVFIRPAAAQDVNAEYKSPDLDVQVWVNRFEVEGREVFDYRNEIIAATGLQPGQRVADGFSLQEAVVMPGFKETFMRRFIRN